MVLEMTLKAKSEDEDGDLSSAYYTPGSVVNAFHVFIYISLQPQVRLAVIILITTLQMSKVTEVELFAQGDLVSREFSPRLFDPQSPVLSCSHRELKPKE